MQFASAGFDDIVTWLRGSGLEIVIFVTGAVLLNRVVRWLGHRVTRRIDKRDADATGIIPTESAKHGHVVAQVVTWVAVVLIYCVVAVLILQRLNVPITGLVAPAAVIGVALGFGAQRIVQDVLAGLFIIAERQYGFGDVVRIAALGSESGISGTVEQVTLRITRLRTANGEVVTVANGQIVQVTNMSRDWARAVVDVPVPATVDVQLVRDLLSKVGREAYADDDLHALMLDPPTVLGVESLEVDTLHVRMVARTLPGKQFEVGRALRSRVAVALHAEGIVVAAGMDAAEPVGTT